MRRLCLPLLCLLFAFSSWAVADDKQSTKSAPARKAKLTGKRKPFHMTASREAAALAFVQEHHSELGQVLKQLRNMQPDQYEQAIGDLFETSEQLADLHGRDEKHFALALESWKTQSRIELLAARMVGNDSPRLRKELEQLLNKQLDLRLEQQQFDIERMQARIKRAQGNIERMKRDREKMVQSSLRRFVGHKPKPASKKKVVSKPAKNTPAK